MFHTNRWATQGFDFLQAIEPAFISALPEDDFLVRKKKNHLSSPHHPQVALTVTVPRYLFTDDVVGLPAEFAGSDE